MDNTKAIVLKNDKRTIENLIEKIEKSLNSIDSLSHSDKLKQISLLEGDSKRLKQSISLLSSEARGLEDPDQEKVYLDHVKVFNSTAKKLKERIEKKAFAIKNSDGLMMEEIDLQEKGIDDMNLQEIDKKGHDLLDQDEDILKRTNKRVVEDIDMAQEINKELKDQADKLDNVNDDLKEIDVSLKRAGKQLRQMMKSFATDKLIMCMIFVIVAIIIAIIVAANVGADVEDKVYLPNDLFVTDTN